MDQVGDLLREFAASTTGRIVLGVVVLLVLLLILAPLWRSLKYLFKALMWGLLVILALVLGALAVWVWMKKEADDPARLEAVEREAFQTLRSGWTNAESAPPAGGDTEEPMHED